MSCGPEFRILYWSPPNPLISEWRKLTPDVKNVTSPADTFSHSTLNLNFINLSHQRIFIVIYISFLALPLNVQVKHFNYSDAFQRKRNCMSWTWRLHWETTSFVLWKKPKARSSLVWDPDSPSVFKLHWNHSWTLMRLLSSQALKPRKNHAEIAFKSENAALRSWSVTLQTASWGIFHADASPEWLHWSHWLKWPCLNDLVSKYHQSNQSGWALIILTVYS